ncbi:MAG: endolytic transglycosylase MltG [Clostridia bacterium]|nr:endolytic transglycosylase MltG [Clostridia bacterium]
MSDNAKRPIKKINKIENSSGRKTSSTKKRTSKPKSQVNNSNKLAFNSSNFSKKFKTVNQNKKSGKSTKKTVRTRKPKNAFEEITFKVSDLYNAKPRLFYWLGVVLASIILSIIMLSCINDVMGINRSHETKTVNIPDNATTNQIIGILDRENLIKNSLFCKMFIGFTNGVTQKSKPTYLSGVYYLSPDMGVEKMLLACMRRKTAKTVRVTIPEGLSLDEIAIKLEKAEVCTSKQFFKTVDEGSFDDFEFIKAMPNKEKRYRTLEGYLYPDTYDFYVADNPTNVINTILKNTKRNWPDDYEKKAKNLGMTMDEVITLASIIQKEAANKAQMDIISSILHNRLNSNKFSLLQCDSTGDYLTKIVKPNIKPIEFTKYQTLYNTYYRKNLPVGPICNPGKDAITAALNPGKTEYYFFNHDNTGKIYLGRNDKEHEENVYKAMVANNANN